MPTLALWGDHDPFVPVSFAHRFASARVIILLDAGHWVAHTQPQRLVDEARGLVAAKS